MTKSKRTFAFICLLMLTAFSASAQKAFAKDDFGKIVHHIEANYHVHRQHRWVMGLAGFTVRFWHIAGVKNFKGAIFENQPVPQRRSRHQIRSSCPRRHGFRLAAHGAKLGPRTAASGPTSTRRTSIRIMVATT